MVGWVGPQLAATSRHRVGSKGAAAGQGCSCPLHSRRRLRWRRRHGRESVCGWVGEAHSEQSAPAASAQTALRHCPAARFCPHLCTHRANLQCLRLDARVASLQLINADAGALSNRKQGVAGLDGVGAGAAGGAAAAKGWRGGRWTLGSLVNWGRACMVRERWACAAVWAGLQQPGHTVASE